MNKRIPIVGAVVVIAALVAAYAWRGTTHAAAGPLTLYGNVDIREVELAFRQPGRIARVAVDEGATVKRGDVLAELDAKPFDDAVLAARAGVAQAQAELDKLRHGNRRQEVAQAQEAVRQAEAVLTETEQQLARQTTLLAEGASSQRAVEAARSARAQAQAALGAARQGLSLRQEGARREDIAAAMARVAAADAQLAQAQTALADARLVAPTDALVSTRIREPGSMAGANVPVLTLSLTEPVVVRAYVSQVQLAQVQPGSAVTVTADGTSERFRGSVGFISPRAEFTPKSVETTELRTDLVYRLRIVVPGAAKALRQGMPVTVRLGDGSAS